MAVQNTAALNAHLQDCGARYTRLSSDVNGGHKALSDRMDGIMKVLLGATGALILGLFTIVGVLLHNGGRF